MNMMDKFALERNLHINIPWFQYFQLRDSVDNPRIKQSILRPLTEFERLIENGFNNTKGNITVLYKLVDLDLAQILSYTKCWEADLGKPISEEQWLKVWRSNTYKSKSINIHIQTFKLLARWYLTQSKLNYIFPRLQLIYWKLCSERGSYTHC